MRIWRGNPWYWEIGGKPALLLGGSDADNLFNRPSVMKQNFQVLARCAGNYARCVLSSRDAPSVEPYERIEGKYDLYRFNREYWDRLDDCCREAAARGIVLQVEIWATSDFHGAAWLVNPFNGVNNVNFRRQDTTLPVEWPHDAEHGAQPFFHTVPDANDDATVLGFQRAFVDKALDVTLKFDNVLYCVDADVAAPPAWGRFWGEYINKEAARKGLGVNLTEAWGPVDARHPGAAEAFSRPDLFNYVDISRANALSERVHWDAVMRLRKALSAGEDGPRPMNNVNVFAFGEGGALDVSAASERFWQNIFAGCASAAFASGAGARRGLGLNANAQKIIAAARVFADAFDFFRAAPAENLLIETPASGAYCSARPPEAYAVYLPDGGTAHLDLSRSERAMALRWFDPREARFLPARVTQGGRRISLASPDADKEWLALVEKG